MTTPTNDYSNAVEVAGGLYAVKLSAGGWSIADGPGTLLCDPDERELAGWHLPVHFPTKDAAIAAICNGPHAMFDIEPESVWSLHCVTNGATTL